MAGFVFWAVLKGPSHQGGDSEEDFIEEVRALQEDAPGYEGTGQLPPAGADESLVPIVELDPSPLVIDGISNKTQTHAEIKVHNRGKATLQITSVKTNCACAQGRMDRDLIAPGEAGVLRVVVDPFRIYGFEAEKRLTVYTNDPVNGAVDVKIRVTIQPEFALEPMDIDFGEVQKGAPAQATAVLRPLQDEVVGIEKVEPLGDLDMAGFTFAERPEAEWTRAGFPEYVIAATLEDHLIPGAHEQLYKVHLKCKRVPFLTCKATAFIDAFYHLSPTTLVIKEFEPGPAPVIHVRGTQPFELADVRAESPDLEVSAKPGPRPNTFEIHSRIVPEAPAGRRNTAILFIVKTADQAFKNRMTVQYVAR